MICAVAERRDRGPAHLAAALQPHESQLEFEAFPLMLFTEGHQYRTCRLVSYESKDIKQLMSVQLDAVPFLDLGC